ncbi:MAG: hypothetical protein EOP34_11100 [Rickettsiales bacterium]|nr:MAG: hypothetical protein EOP34_11100 [Rickettsiales bacterium]
MSANVSSNFRNSRDWYDAISKGSQIADSNGYSNSLNQTIRNSDQINFSDNEQNERALAKDLAKSFEKMQSIRHSENISKQNVERLSDAQNYMKSYGGNLNQDLSQKFLEYIATQKVNTSSNLNHAPSEIGHSTARKIIMTKGEDYYAYLQGFMGQELGNMTGNSHISGKFRFDNIDQSNIEPIQDRNLTSENLTLALPNINYKDKERNLLYDNDMNLKRQKVKDSVSSEYERFEKRKAQQFAEIDTEHTRLENNYVDQSIKIKLSKAISNIPKALISQKDIKDNNQTKNHKENNVNSDFKDITKLFEKKSDD